MDFRSVGRMNGITTIGRFQLGHLWTINYRYSSLLSDGEG